MSSRQQCRVVTVLVATVFCLLDGTSRAQDDELRLRVNDATGVPGGLVAIVVRTYAPRGIRQGQMCFRALWNETEGYGDTPFVGLESAIVFSQRSDAESDGVFEEVHVARPVLPRGVGDVDGAAHLEPADVRPR